LVKVSLQVHHRRGRRKRKTLKPRMIKQKRRRKG